MNRQTEEFINTICELPQEGETVLLVQQKPILRDGGIEYHNDGAPKATWPAYRPARAKRKIKKGDAWYVNTGAFIEDNFVDGPSASRNYADYVMFMMLDDVGTKAKIPPIEPSWVMETSEGSFQWGYIFEEQPTTDEFAAAIFAIAQAGYTDAGAINPVRNCRIPGSVNLKKGRNNFAARLVEWNPDRRFNLDDICDALNVVPGPPIKANQAIKLEDTGSDEVLAWLNDHNLVYSGINREGWVSITCPNFAEHTDGNPEARYKPSDRTFLCYHGHCQHLTSTPFLKWVKEQGGPDCQHGVRTDILTDKLKNLESNITSSEMFSNDAASTIEDVERQESARVERSQWFDRFAYLMSDDSYFDILSRREISRKSFNAIFRGHDTNSMHGNGSRVPASLYFDERRSNYNGRVLVGVTYAPGETEFVAMDGEIYGNLWRDARPDVSSIGPISDDDIRPWLDHCRKLVPDESQLQHCFDVMAFKRQFPRIKINHAILHGGYVEGSGKDTMWAPFLWSVAGPSHRNRSIVDADKIASQFHYHLEAEIVVLNELKEPEARERRALSNKIKPLLAAPPETIPINRKGLSPYDMVNRLFVLSFTNDPVPISIASEDRRWFCVWTEAQAMKPEDAEKIWSWFNKGGFMKIAAWLQQRDVSAFNPKAAPPMTEWKEAMIINGRSSGESYLVDAISKGVGPFAKGVVGAPFHILADQLHDIGIVPTSVKMPLAAILHSLKEAGWVDLGRVGAAKPYDTKKHLFATRQMVDSYSKSELRRMVDSVDGDVASRLSVIK